MKSIAHFARGLVTAVLMTAAAGPAVAGWQALAAQLESLGWTVVEEADGTLTLYPPSGGTVSDTGGGDVVTVRGWDIAREADGSLTLTRSREAAPAPVTAAPPSAPRVDPSAAAYLESLGWRVERAGDGSLLLFPPGRVAAPAPGRQQREPVVEPAPAADQRITEAATIGELRDHGWIVEYADDGSILLYPPSPVAPPASEVAPQPVVPVPEAAPVTADFSDDAVLDLLEQRGWTVERAPDGALLLYPRNYAAPPAETNTEALPGACAGHRVAALASGQIEPPLDNLADVQAIAEAWVADTALSGVAVGRIRQVFRVYLVSIVDAAPPHRLRHQLAIGRDNGRVIPLD